MILSLAHLSSLDTKWVLPEPLGPDTRQLNGCFQGAFMVVINNRDTLCHDLNCKQSTVSLHRRYSVYSAHKVHYAETLWQVALCGQSTVSLHSKAHVPTQHRQHSVYSAHKVHYAETLWQVALCGKSVVSLNRRYSVYSAHKVHYAETVWNVVGFNATNLQLNFTSFNFSTKYTPPNLINTLS